MRIKKIFEIELDEPSPHWLDAQTVYDALSNAFGHAEEKAVKYSVIELARYPDYDGQRIEHTNVHLITTHSPTEENAQMQMIKEKAKECKGGFLPIDIVYGDSRENIYEQSIARGKKRCKNLGIEPLTFLPFYELNAIPAGVRECPKCGKWICSFDPNPCKCCGHDVNIKPPTLTEEEKKVRFLIEVSKLGNCIMGIGMCAGCGKVRGSTSIYSGVPCEECGYKPDCLTQESIAKGETK